MRPTTDQGIERCLTLVLSRKFQERIHIDLPDGRRITLVVVEIDRGKVRLGIDAPRDCPIYRSELLPPAPAPAGKES